MLQSYSNMLKPLLSAALLLTCMSHAHAGDRLLASGGVIQVEGAAGGGLAPWAVINGYGTRDQVGATGFYTRARTQGGFELEIGGVGLGVANRFELTLSQQRFGLGNTVPGENIKLTTLGAKVRLLGDAVYDQDTWLPQLALGVQLKHNEDFDLVPKALGARHASGVDVYLAATKVYLNAIYGRNLLLNVTLQATKANQFGLLGFGGDRNNHYQLQPAVSMALMLRDNLLLGFEYRAKPDNLSVFAEDDAKDVFVTWFPYRPLAITAAYVDLGNIANKPDQHAWYLSGQLSY